MAHEIHKRRGMVKTTVDFFKEASEETLEALYSNFYPFAIDNNMIPVNGIITMYGLSPFFDVLGEAQVLPEYEVTFTPRPGGIGIEFVKIN